MWALTTIGRQVIGTYSRAEVICSGLDPHLCGFSWAGAGLLVGAVQQTSVTPGLLK